MPDIIEQLETGKKLQEEEGIDADSLRTKVNSSKEEIAKKPKQKKKKKQEKKVEKGTKELSDPFEQAEQIMNPNNELITKEEKPEKYPGFDFNNYYEKGQKIFYIRVLGKLEVKEFLELKIRTVYPKMIVACEEKKATVCIGPDTKDMIFTDKKSALETYDNVKITTYKDINPKDELGDVEINDTED